MLVMWRFLPTLAVVVAMAALTPTAAATLTPPPLRVVLCLRRFLRGVEISPSGRLPSRQAGVLANRVSGFLAGGLGRTACAVTFFVQRSCQTSHQV